MFTDEYIYNRFEPLCEFVNIFIYESFITL